MDGFIIYPVSKLLSRTDLILQPPDDTPYDRLKQQLIKRTAASEQKRLQQLFHAEELGDRKPSQFLRRMQQLLADKARETDNAFICELFMQRLPANVRMVLASIPDTGNLDELAQLADKIMEVAIPSGPTIAAVSSTTSKLEHLRKELAELKSLLQGLRFPKQPSTRRSPSPNRQPQEQLLICWYHNKYGDNAQKCKPSCKKSGNFRPRAEGDGRSWPFPQSPIL